MRSRFTKPLVLTLLLACAASTAFAANIADVQIEPSAVVFKPSGDLERGEFALTVSGPDECVFEFRFREGEEIVFVNRGPEGGALDDGQYSYQLTHLPILSQKDRDILAQARINDDMLEKKRLKEMGVIRRTLAQSGFFSVDRGQFVHEDLKEEEGVKKGLEAPADVERLDRASSVDGAGLVGSAEEYTITGDLTVYNSMCVGFDCLTNETYGADTIRLKENNLRIHFEDTSTAAGFPANDWRIVANAQANGGANKFSVDDVSANRTPFTIEAGAVNNALYVDNGGRVGVATPNPVLEMHLNNGDTPGLRLEQNSSSGFAAQTWDVAGNETSFFVRDATNGSTLPFRIRPGAPSNSLAIGTDGNVGIGTLSPDANLDVVQNGQVLVELEDTSGESWNIVLDSAGASDGLSFTRVGSGVREFRIANDGSIYTGATQVHPDFVFEEDYDLMSLTELEAFVKENRHLPGVQSAKDVEVEGLNLTRLQNSLLQKVEELTLYLIDQEKRALRQEERIELLEGLLKE